MDRLRISGGSRRGRRLISPPANSIRPASDMIRQAVFNMLGATIEGCVFIDVFAGTGIVGLEALSRGADRVIFVEKDRKQIQLIRKNLELARFGPEASIRNSDAFVWAKHFHTDGRPTIVFLGPPYPDVLEGPERFMEMIAAVQKELGDDDWLVVQLPSLLHLEAIPDSDHWHRLRKYGKSYVGLWRPLQPEGSSEESTVPDDETDDEQTDDA